MNSALRSRFRVSAATNSLVAIPRFAIFLLGCAGWPRRHQSLSLVKYCAALFSSMHGEKLGVNPKVAGLVEFGGTYPGAYLLRRGLFMPWELPEVLGPDLAREGLKRLDPINHIACTLMPDPLQPFARVATLESSLYMRNQLLRDTDWASMAHSLEVRVPLVDAVLLEKLASIRPSIGQPKIKALLAEAPSQPFRRGMIQRRKTGFNVPIAKWIGRQQQSAMSEWKRVPLLRSPRCHWSRRWAYSVACGA